MSLTQATEGGMVPARGRARAGFTLIELVTAAAIFSLLGVMLFSMVRSAMTMWKEGEHSRTLVERGVRALEAVRRELRLAFTENDPLAGPPLARFVCDFADYDRDGDGRPELRVQRLRFVRINVEERENLELRTAGNLPGGKHYFTLFQEEPEVIAEEGHLPTAGLAEAAFMSYAPRLKRGEERTGSLHLYRGYRSPPGGEESFFAPGNLERPEEVETQLRPVMDGILYLEFRFWNQYTQTFDPVEAPPESREGAGYTWDSTRGILPGERRAAPNAFRFAAGNTSMDDPADDLFPARVLVTVVVEDPGDRARLPRLVEPLGDTEMRITVDAPRLFERVRKEDRFVRVDEEWIAFSRLEGRELVVARRGARHTLPAAHAAGTRLHLGRRFSTVVALPGHREDWNTPPAGDGEVGP